MIKPISYYSNMFNIRHIKILIGNIFIAILGNFIINLLLPSDNFNLHSKQALLKNSLDRQDGDSLQRYTIISC